VVWEDYRNGLYNPDIYWLRLSDPNLVQNRFDLPGKQVNPAVQGDTIVWQDDQVSANRDIYVYDILSGTIANLPDGAHQRKPVISEQVIVCETLFNGYYNAAVWNAAAGKFDPIAPYAASQLELAVDGFFVVWRDLRDGKQQIYGCDLSDNVPTAVPLAPKAIAQMRPSISGNIVVWEETTTETTALTAFDRSTGTVVWTHTVPFVEAWTSICDGIIVWQQCASGRSDYDIRGYDLNTGAFYDIATGLKDDRYPVISDRTVVWQRNGSDIIAAVIETLNRTVLTVLKPVGGEMFRAGSRIEIAWAAVEGAPPATVSVDFSSEGENWVQEAAGVPFDEPYVWSAKAVTSNNCRIRVRALQDEPISAASEAFAVFQCSPDLTADLTGDCFVDIEDFAAMAAQWLASGNPYDPAYLNN
jgi:beta propeller repeat protein